MNYHFFAAEADKLHLLDFLFTETDLRVFDSYSPYGQEVRRYKSTSEIATTFDLAVGSQFAVSLSLWAPSFLGMVDFEMITLNPKACKGHNFRYRTNGWGLLHLHLGSEQNNTLRYSSLSHFNQKEAAANEQTLPALAKMDSWNWPEINRTGRRLKYLIHQKLAVAKLGSIGILPGAAERQRQGIILR